MKYIILCVVFLIQTANLYAQQRGVPQSQQFRLGDRFIRVAEPGELVDTVNVWGDLQSTGKYLIPRKTFLVDLISFGFGPSNFRDNQTNLDWSKMRVEININRELNDGRIELRKFKYRFEDPFPEEMYSYIVNNNDIITVRVKRKPSFRDYLGVFASTVSAVASTIILLDRLDGK